MEKTSTLSLCGIILLEDRSATSFSLIGIISLCTVLTWLTTLHHLYSCVMYLLQKVCKGRAEGKHAAMPSDSDPNHVNEDEKLILLSVGEVEVVMEKLGIFYQPNRDDEVGDRLGLDDVTALFGEGEVSLEEGREAFGVFDENRDGFIDASELERVLCKLGFTEVVSEVECRRMIATFDDNGDGLIDFSEFVKLLENSSW